MCLLSLPLEVLLQIIEHPVLSKEDIGNLRIVHPTLNHILAPRLLREIGFDFSKIECGGRHQAIAVSRRTQRLHKILKSARNSQNASSLPRKFFLVVDHHQTFRQYFSEIYRPKKDYIRDITTFTQVFITRFSGILQVFPNIEEIHVAINLACLDVEDAEDLVGTVCQAITVGRPRRMYLHLMGLTSKRRSLINSLMRVQLTLESLKLSCAETRCLDGVLTDVRSLLRRSSKDIKSLELQNFGNAIGGVLSGLQKQSGIQTLRIQDDKACSKKAMDLKYSKLSNLSSLKTLEFLGRPTRGPMTVFWKMLKNCPTIKLNSLTTIKLDNDILNYLLNQNTIRDLNISVDVTHQCDSEPGNSLETIRANFEQLAFKFFTQTLPHMQGQLRSLEFHMESAPYEDPDFPFLDNFIPGNLLGHTLSVPTPDFKERTKCFSFGGITYSNVVYNFPSLESISTWISSEEHSFAKFMNAINESPRLKEIKLEMEIPVTYRRCTPIEDSGNLEELWSRMENYMKRSSYIPMPRWSEIENYIGGGHAWKDGLRLEIQERLGSIISENDKRKKSQKRLFEFRKKQWVPISKILKD